MLILFAISLAFIIIYFYNWIVFSLNSKVGDISHLMKFFSPGVEETVKTSIGYIMGNYILEVHIGIGLIEGVIDLIKTKKFGGTIGSIVGHSIFGMITLLVFLFTGYLFIGIMIGVIAHMLWNNIILYLTGEAKK